MSFVGGLDAQGARRLPRPRHPLLATRDGASFLAAQSLDALAEGLTTVALPWLVLARGGSPALAGLVLTLTMLPYALLGLPFGALADRLPRRPLVALTHAGQAACAALLPVLVLTGVRPPVALVLVVAFAIGAGKVATDAAAFGIVSRLVGREEFVRAQALLSASWSLGLLAGPALGGALIALVGPLRTLAVEAAAFALAAALIATLRAPVDAGRHRAARACLRADLCEGLEFVLRKPLVRAFTLLTVAWNVAAAGVPSLIVPLLRTRLQLSPAQTGAVVAAGAAMGLLSGLVTPRLEARLGAVRLALGAAVAAAAGALLLGLAWGLVPALAGFCLVSLVDWAMMAVIVGARQREAPEELQSRVGMTGRTVAMATFAAGSALASLLADVLPLDALYLLMGGGTLLAAGLCAPLLVRAERVPRLGRARDQRLAGAEPREHVGQAREVLV